MRNSEGSVMARAMAKVGARAAQGLGKTQGRWLRLGQEGRQQRGHKLEAKKGKGGFEAWREAGMGRRQGCGAWGCLAWRGGGLAMVAVSAES